MTKAIVGGVAEECYSQVDGSGSCEGGEREDRGSKISGRSIGHENRGTARRRSRQCVHNEYIQGTYEDEERSATCRSLSSTGKQYS